MLVKGATASFTSIIYFYDSDVTEGFCGHVWHINWCWNLYPVMHYLIHTGLCKWNVLWWRWSKCKKDIVVIFDICLVIVQYCCRLMIIWNTPLLCHIAIITVPCYLSVSLSVGLQHFVWNNGTVSSCLTHWSRDKMTAIFQTTFSNTFSWMKIYKLRLRFHWRLFPRIQLTICKHWLR